MIVDSPARNAKHPTQRPEFPIAGNVSWCECEQSTIPENRPRVKILQNEGDRAIAGRRR